MQTFSKLLIGLVALPFLLAAQSKSEPKINDIEGTAQGTTYHLRYVGPEKPGFKKDLDEQLAAFEKIFSNYRLDSEISRFNAAAHSEWFPAHPKLVHLVELSHKISVESQGAFDITIGALLKIWGFGPFKRKIATIPSETEIAAAKKNVDYHQLLFRKNPPALKKMHAQVYVDVSGIAQGYSVDEIAAFIEKSGIKSYLIEIGGEIKTKGRKPSGAYWDIAIESPSYEPGESSVTVYTRGKALTTAGDYRDYFEKDGKRFSHTIDPRSGKPIEHQLASVTVIMDSAAEADAWDTALMVLGPEAGRSLAQKKQIASFMIKRQSSSFVSEYLAGFGSFVSK